MVFRNPILAPLVFLISAAGVPAQTVPAAPDRFSLRRLPRSTMHFARPMPMPGAASWVPVRL